MLRLRCCHRLNLNFRDNRPRKQQSSVQVALDSTADCKILIEFFYKYNVTKFFTIKQYSLKGLLRV